MHPGPQLEMAWPAWRRRDPPAAEAPPGYAVRPHRAGEEARFFALMALAGWPGWDAARLRPWAERLLPDGWLVVADERTGQVVASAMALRSEAFAGAGELGWLAGDPAHAGRGIGRAASAAVTARMLGRGAGRSTSTRRTSGAPRSGRTWRWATSRCSPGRARQPGGGRCARRSGGRTPRTPGQRGPSGAPSRSRRPAARRTRRSTGVRRRHPASGVWGRSVRGRPAGPGVAPRGAPRRRQR